MGIVATELAAGTGAIVHWRLSGDVAHDSLSSAIDAQPQLSRITAAPATPSPEVALNRAMDAVRTKSLLARRIKAGTWGVVRETVDATHAKLTHSHELTVSVNSAGVIAASDVAHELFDVVVSAYSRELETLNSHDISAWLCRLMDKLRAVSLRQGGGLYYLPPQHAAVLSELRTVLQTAGARLYSIPAANTRDVVENVLDGLTDEVAAVSDAVLVDADELGARARETRQQRLRELLAKVSEYERLLGVALPKLSEQANNATAALVASTMRSNP